MTNLALDSIRLDGGTQPRAATDFVMVEEYAVAMGDGATFPPAVVFFDGTDHWLADGFHRWHAHKACGLVEIECDVRQGTVRDAILYSVGANAAHGMQRTNADKRRAVMRLLDDAEWCTWSDREIGRRCAVDHEVVGRLRPAKPSHTGVERQYEHRTFTHPKTGLPTQMRTENIGKASELILYETPQQIEDRRNYVSPRAEQIARDNANGWISSAIWEIDRQLSALPEPAEAADRFPVSHRHTLDLPKLMAHAAWLAEFVDHIRSIEGERNVAAE